MNKLLLGVCFFKLLALVTSSFMKTGKVLAGKFRLDLYFCLNENQNQTSEKRVVIENEQSEKREDSCLLPRLCIFVTSKIVAI